MSKCRDRIEVRCSPIHGQGLYALCCFRLGSRIGTFEGVETQVDGDHVLWLTDEQGIETGIEGRNELRFLNHASRPNAELDGLALQAVRNIQPGHEITIDYGEGWEDFG
ncbi:MAG: SET domain-containing protein [Myxococcota bacterium]